MWSLYLTSTARQHCAKAYKLFLITLLLAASAPGNLHNAQPGVHICGRQVAIAFCLNVEMYRTFAQSVPPANSTSPPAHPSFASEAMTCTSACLTTPTQCTTPMQISNRVATASAGRAFEWELALGFQSGFSNDLPIASISRLLAASYRCPLPLPMIRAVHTNELLHEAGVRATEPCERTWL